MFQIRSHSTRCAPPRQSGRDSLGLLQHRRELPRVEVALVEQLLGCLDDRGHDPGPADNAARGADGAVAASAGDLADRKRQLGGAGERVAALVHRGRAGVRGLPRPRDPVALDAEGAQDDAQREPQPLQHRALLDVELQVAAADVELRRASWRGRGRRRTAPSASGSCSPRGRSLRSSSWSIVPEAALDPNRLRRTARLPRRPSRRAAP